MELELEGFMMMVLKFFKHSLCLLILGSGLGIFMVTPSLAVKKTSNWTLDQCLKVCGQKTCYEDRKFQCKRNCKAFKKTSKIVKNCIVGYQRAAKDEMREGVQKQKIEMLKEKNQQSQNATPTDERERLFDQPPYEGAERLFD